MTLKFSRISELGQMAPTLSEAPTPQASPAPEAWGAPTPDPAYRFTKSDVEEAYQAGLLEGLNTGRLLGVEQAAIALNNEAAYLRSISPDRRGYVNHWVKTPDVFERCADVVRGLLRGCHNLAGEALDHQMLEGAGVLACEPGA